MKSKKNTEITNLEKLYTSTRKLRNLLAHSYLVPQNNQKFNGKNIKLTKLSNSNRTGYEENLQINEYNSKIEQLKELVKIVFEMVKKIKTE